MPSPKDPASYIPPAKHPVIHQAALDACDARDGLKDGAHRRSDALQLRSGCSQCKGADGASVPDRGAGRRRRSRSTAPATDAADGEIFPALEPGSELGWATCGRSAAARRRPVSISSATSSSTTRTWDWTTFNFDTDIARARRDATTGLMNAHRSQPEAVLRPRRQAAPLSRLERSADLAAEQRQVLQARRRRRRAAPEVAGRRIGCSWRRAWGTAAAAKDRTLRHGGRARATGSRRARRRSRSSRRTSTDGKVDRTRPLCPYPQVARYKGRAAPTRRRTSRVRHRRSGYSRSSAHHHRSHGRRPGCAGTARRHRVGAICPSHSAS